MATNPVCGYHRDVLAAMAAHGHVDDEATAQAWRDLSRQCPDCLAAEGFTAPETTANLAA